MVGSGSANLEEVSCVIFRLPRRNARPASKPRRDFPSRWYIIGQTLTNFAVLLCFTIIGVSMSTHVTFTTYLNNSIIYIYIYRFYTIPKNFVVTKYVLLTSRDYFIIKNHRYLVHSKSFKLCLPI